MSAVAAAAFLVLNRRTSVPRTPRAKSTIRNEHCSSLHCSLTSDYNRSALYTRPYLEMKLSTSCTFLVVVLLGVLQPIHAGSTVIGHIDSVRGGKVSGWACQKYLARSIAVHLYVGNAAGRRGATLLKGVSASRRSEGAVARECGTGFRYYRFVIHLSQRQRRRHRGKKVYVHGIRRQGRGHNPLITNSGRYKLYWAADFMLVTIPVTMNRHMNSMGTSRASCSSLTN